VNDARVNLYQIHVFGADPKSKASAMAGQHFSNGHYHHQYGRYWYINNQNTVESGAKHHKPNHHTHSRVFNNQQSSNVKISVKQFVFNHVFSSEEKVSL
jgi:K+-transporting ATPase c subunit